MSGRGVAWNTIVKGGTLALSIPVEIWFTRFVVSRLGNDVYGVVALTTNTVLLASVVIYAILTTLARFMTLDSCRGNTLSASRTFNVAFFSLLGFSLLFLGPLFVGISWYSPVLFEVPIGQEAACQFLFAATLLSLLITNSGSVLSVGTFIYNRLDLVDLLNILRLLSSRILSMLLIVMLGWQLVGIGVGLLAASVLGLCINAFLWKKLTPDLRLSIRAWDSNLFHSMSSFAWWLFVRQVGARALVSLDLIVVNLLYGPEQTGFYGIAFFFPSKLRLLTGTFFGLFNPIIVSRYASGDINGMMNISCKAMRIIGITFALPIGLLCGLYKLVLHVWMGPEYTGLYFIAVILTVHVGINTCSNILSSISSATDKVKVPSIISIAAAVANTVLAVGLGWPALGLGLAGVALAGAITLTLNNAVFMPYYVARTLGRSSMPLYQALLPGLAGTLLTMGGAYAISTFQAAYSVSGLLIAAISVSAAYAVCAWFLLMDASEREWFASIIIGKSLQPKNGKIADHGNL